MTSSCAGTNTIAALLAGAADPEAAQRLEVHLDACPACRQLVADLGRGLSALGSGAGQEGSAVGRLPRVGDKLGRYDVRRIVGVGGMGVVYEAHDSALDRRVAIKVLRPDIVEDGAAQLLVEAKAMARLRHPNVAILHDVGLFEGQVYLCMEYVSGTTLRAWSAERARSWREILAVFTAAGRGLSFVHRTGLVHLDFKPDNVLVCGPERVVVTDFGLARMIGGQRHTHSPRVALGTPAYMAPEQRSGQATDARTDQFGFCAALEEALRGADAPAWLRRAIARGLAPLPAERFPSMEALLAAFEAGLRRPRRRLMAAVGTAFAVILAVLAARATTTVTRIVERPVTRMAFPSGVFAPTAPERMAPTALGSPATDRAASSAPFAPSADSSSSDTTPAERATLATAFTSTTREGGRLAAKALSEMWESAIAPAERASESSGDLSGAARCDDGSQRSCPLPEPACPSGTIASIHDGCWSCADAGTCAQLGLPRTCNDGTRLSCTDAAPACPPRQVAAVRKGCWSCQDAFSCMSWSWAVPTKAPRSAASCGNGVCEAGEDRSKCPTDCGDLAKSAAGTGSGGSDGRMLNSSGGSEATLTGSGGGDGLTLTGSGGGSGQDGTQGPEAAVCGNGLCERGESHTSCASDCCETTSSGACVAACGNGFCEDGEDARGCPSDCG
jgi:serine/threonine-protein kinase